MVGDIPLSFGYKSSAGWDPCTGLGVIDGTALVERFMRKRHSGSGKPLP
jgi:hypothetical protein